MVNVKVCIGSSCHLKGSREIIETLQTLIKNSGKSEQINLAGAFCIGKCSDEGVAMTINDEYFSVKPENIEEFFKQNILSKTN